MPGDKELQPLWGILTEWWTGHWELFKKPLIPLKSKIREMTRSRKILELDILPWGKSIFKVIKEAGQNLWIFVFTLCWFSKSNKLIVNGSFSVLLMQELYSCNCSNEAVEFAWVCNTAEIGSDTDTVQNMFDYRRYYDLNYRRWLFICLVPFGSITISSSGFTRCWFICLSSV